MQDGTWFLHSWLTNNDQSCMTLQLSMELQLEKNLDMLPSTHCSCFHNQYDPLSGKSVQRNDLMFALTGGGQD
jgi:hypothetical protein